MDTRKQPSEVENNPNFKKDDYGDTKFGVMKKKEQSWKNQMCFLVQLVYNLFGKCILKIRSSKDKQHRSYQRTEIDDEVQSLERR